MPKPVLSVFPRDDSTTRVYAHIDRVGASTSPDFVLVHGIGMSHRYFRRLHARLAAAGNVYSIDLPGYGGNRRPRASMSVRDGAVAIAATLDAMGLRSCVVVGHSMGAQFAADLGILRPDLVSHLVLIAPVVDPRHPTALGHALPMMVNSLFEKPIINAIEFADYVRCGPRWYFSQLREMTTHSIAGRLALVTMPVLVLRGARDALVTRQWSTALAACVTGGRAESIRGGAHVIQYSQPKRVAAAIARFLAPTAV
ncbi:alpha/beta fold hydrolase [Planctomonas psychrotolerans]|uniref:alpha/beta fold hydrolase n=1 Tax=Planctomonas psychrotolerans TaxID=2528712 RepID=UPI00123A733E|nr:alpha/beta fold hydrolase [Planctomonas psychrotolerans]